MEILFYVKRTDLNLQDLAFSFDDITLLNDEKLFRIEKEPTRPYEQYEEVVMLLTFEHHFDR